MNQKLDEIAERLFKEAETKAERDLIRLRKEEILVAYEGEDRIIHAKERYDWLKSQPQLKTWNSGFKRLDHVTEGFGEEQLVVITGVTKSGKTSLAIDLMKNMSDKKPLLFALEQSADELLRKEIKFGREAFDAYVPQVIGNSKVNVDWIEERILESVLKFGTKVVLIDHLHFMIDISGEDRRFDLTITATVARLKKIAQTYKVLIMLVCHLKKTKIEEEPTIFDLRDSSSIAQLADKVLIVWRESTKELGKIKYTGNTILRVAVDRQSGTNEAIVLGWDKGRYFETGEGFEEAVEILNGTFSR